MNVKLTDRDKNIIQFLKQYKCADTHTLAKLFFQNTKSSQILCERRLKRLVDAGHLRRWRADILHPYIFYCNKRPTNIVHSTMISSVYAELMTKYQVVKIEKEYEVRYKASKLRTDVMAILRIDGKLKPLFIELDLSGAMKNKYDIYINENYYQQKFGVKPTIISISKFKPKSSIPVKHIPLDEFKENGITIE